MPKTNPLVKICGLTSEEQALQVAKLGANAIGIISVEESPRYVSAEIKKKIFKTLENFYPKIDRVSVVQNCPIDLIIKNFLGNPSETIIQLHGDEDIDYCKKIRGKIPNIGLWKAFRIKTEKDIDKIKPFEDIVDAILLDSWNEKTYGGSGKKIKSIYNIEKIYNYYGLIEQTGSIFIECPKCSCFKCSIYSDILIRDTNLEIIKKDKKKGFLQVLSLLPTSYPGNSLLTEDIAELRNDIKCDCDNGSQKFIIHGRSKNSEIRGCANI